MEAVPAPTAVASASSSLSQHSSVSASNSSKSGIENYNDFNENPRTFLNSLLSEEDRNILANIYIYREKLLNEIKELEVELADVQSEIEQIDVSDTDSKNNPKAKQISLGKKKFNIDPKQGMRFLIESNLIENTPEAVAQFLFNGEGINKVAIGIYLGERDDFNLQVLKEFVGLYDFKNKSLIDALREFLLGFQLPGESQKIDRVIELFAEHYSNLNPTVVSKDGCHIIAFATIMLNTTLYNPNSKDRMPYDRFVKMCREGCKDEEIAEQLFKDIYNSIKREELKRIQNDGNEFMLTFYNPIRDGWLWKQGGRFNKVWQRRWFILNDGCLYYFEFTTDKEPKGIIPLENVNVREVDDKTKQFCFEIYSTTNDKIKACKHDSDGKVVEVGNHAVYRMSALTAEDKNEWIKRIRDCISENPLMNTTSKRKINGMPQPQTSAALNHQNSSGANSSQSFGGGGVNTTTSMGNESSLHNNTSSNTSRLNGSSSNSSALYK